VILGLMIPARSRLAASDVIKELAAHTTALAQSPRETDQADAEILAIEGKLEDLEPPLNRFEHLLHPFVAFAVMPLFALANSGVVLEGMTAATLTEPVAVGAGLGLFLGKQLGIFGFTYAAIKWGISPMPGGAASSTMKLFGTCVTAGIGFTVALFIGALAYPAAPALLAQAKLGILLGSFAAGVRGSLVLRMTPVLATSHDNA
jgi:NhaA family Na+:H+ antiporter